MVPGVVQCGSPTSCFHSPQGKKKKKALQIQDLTVLPRGCDYQVLDFQYCGHSEFYFCPRGTLRSEPWWGEGTVGRDQAQDRQVYPEWTRYQVATARPFPEPPCWAEPGSLHLEVAHKALTLLSWLPTGFSVISELSQARVHSLQSQSTDNACILSSPRENDQGSQKGQPRNEGRQSLS